MHFRLFPHFSSSLLSLVTKCFEKLEKLYRQFLGWYSNACIFEIFFFFIRYRFFSVEHALRLFFSGVGIFFNHAGDL